MRTSLRASIPLRSFSFSDSNVFATSAYLIFFLLFRSFFCSSPLSRRPFLRVSFSLLLVTVSFPPTHIFFLSAFLLRIAYFVHSFSLLSLLSVSLARVSCLHRVGKASTSRTRSTDFLFLCGSPQVLMIPPVPWVETRMHESTRTRAYLYACYREKACSSNVKRRHDPHVNEQ